METEKQIEQRKKKAEKLKFITNCACAIYKATTTSPQEYNAGRYFLLLDMLTDERCKDKPRKYVINLLNDKMVEIMKEVQPEPTFQKGCVSGFKY